MTPPVQPRQVKIDPPPYRPVAQHHFHPERTTDPSVHSRASRRDLPRAEGIARMAEYFAELRAKRSTYLFLPIVSRIDRHQLGPLPRHFELDRTMAEFHHVSLATLVRQIFVLARERDLFFHALLTLHWGTGLERQIGPGELAGMVAHQLNPTRRSPPSAPMPPAMTPRPAPSPCSRRSAPHGTAPCSSRPCSSPKTSSPDPSTSSMPSRSRSASTERGGPPKGSLVPAGRPAPTCG